MYRHMPCDSAEPQGINSFGRAFRTAKLLKEGGIGLGIAMVFACLDDQPVVFAQIVQWPLINPNKIRFVLFALLV